MLESTYFQRNYEISRLGKFVNSNFLVAFTRLISISARSFLDNPLFYAIFCIISKIQT